MRGTVTSERHCFNTNLLFEAHSAQTLGLLRLDLLRDHRKLFIVTA